MSEPVEEAKSSKPWEWPGEWMRDEKFWRDVGSRTIAGYLVVVMGYFSLVALGYLQQPDLLRSIIMFATGLAAGIISLTMITLFGEVRDQSTDDTQAYWKWFRRRLRGPVIAILVLIAPVTYLVLTG